MARAEAHDLSAHGGRLQRDLHTIPDRGAITKPRNPDQPGTDGLDMSEIARQPHPGDLAGDRFNSIHFRFLACRGNRSPRKGF